jgi:AcrR family transcriptional regulator
MSLRAAHAAATRVEIVQAAHRLLDAPQATTLSLDEVARAAGVTRATLYNHFGSRSALLSAVFEDQGRLIGYDSVRAAQELADPREALTSMLRELGRAWALKRVAIRRTLALAVLDPEVETLVMRYETYRRGDVSSLAQRLSKAGLLARGVSLSDAAGILGALTSFQFFDILCLLEPPNVATKRLVQIAGSALLFPSTKQV